MSKKKKSDLNEEAMQNAKEKLDQLMEKEAAELSEEIPPSFPDSPEEKPEEVEPTSAPIVALSLNAGLSFVCSIHGKQALKEIRYTTIILACGCEWIYDCGHLSQSRRGPK